MSILDGAADMPHILVVDDDTRLRELLKSFLSRHGFRVTAAGHAADARQRLQSLDFRDGVVQLKLRAGDAQALERINQSLRAAGWNAELVSGGAAGDAYEGSLRLNGRAS